RTRLRRETQVMGITQGDVKAARRQSYHAADSSTNREQGGDVGPPVAPGIAVTGSVKRMFSPLIQGMLVSAFSFSQSRGASHVQNIAVVRGALPVPLLPRRGETLPPG